MKNATTKVNKWSNIRAMHDHGEELDDDDDDDGSN